jgi:esterase/lipase
MAGAARAVHIRVMPSFWITGSAALLLAVAATVIRQGAGDLAAHPSPARDYTDAAERVRKQQAADDRVAAPGGRSILMDRGRRTPRAIVLFHGFTNSPLQFEPFARLLYAAGDNVYVPRLPRHALRNGTASALAGLTAEELRDCADSAVDVARGLGDTVVIVGLSAGGTMAAWVAQNRPDVGRVVAIAPVLELAHIPSILATVAMKLALHLPEITQNYPREESRPDRELGNSSHAIAQMLRMGMAVRAAAQRAPPGTREITFLVNANDRTVKTAPALALAERWSAAGAAVTVYQLPATLKLPHDVIDETQPVSRPDVVYPALDAMVHGARPAAELDIARLWPIEVRK